MDVEAIQTLRGHRSVPHTPEALYLVCTDKSFLLTLPHTHTHMHTHTHRGAVLCVMVGTDGELCYSGGTDNVIRVWKFPSDTVDPFDLYGKTEGKPGCKHSM